MVSFTKMTYVGEGCWAVCMELRGVSVLFMLPLILFPFWTSKQRCQTGIGYGNIQFKIDEWMINEWTPYGKFSIYFLLEHQWVFDCTNYINVVFIP